MNLRENWNHREHNTHDQVEADDELVEMAATCLQKKKITINDKITSFQFCQLTGTCMHSAVTIFE